MSSIPNISHLVSERRHLCMILSVILVSKCNTSVRATS